MVSLRLPNNPNTTAVVLAALKIVLPAATQLEQASSDFYGQSQIFIESDFTLAQATFPVVSLAASPVKYTRTSRSTQRGAFSVTVTYFNRWDQNPVTLDALWAALSLDLERMKSNVESNDQLVLGNGQSLQTIEKITLSPYYGEFSEVAPGLVCVSRTLTLACLTPPFDS